VAQLSYRDVTGRVVDKRGNGLPGAVVELENAHSLLVRSYITGKDGHYYFNLLSDDNDYTLKARYRRYASKEKRLSKFNSAKHPAITLAVPIE
jgi:hypothetical protein